VVREAAKCAVDEQKMSVNKVREKVICTYLKTGKITHYFEHISASTYSNIPHSDEEKWWVSNLCPSVLLFTHLCPHCLPSAVCLLLLCLTDAKEKLEWLGKVLELKDLQTQLKEFHNPLTAEGVDTEENVIDAEMLLQMRSRRPLCLFVWH
jgi:hypothetical protein